MGKPWKQWQTFFSRAQKALQMMTAAMKLKDAWVLFLSPSDTYVRGFLCLFYTCSSVQSLSRVQLFVTPWIAARQASLSITNSQSSLRLTSIESVMPSSHLILCHQSNVSAFFNTLSRLVIALLPRSKHLLISWLHSPSAEILEPPKIVFHCFRCFPIYLPWSDWTGFYDLSFLNVEF